MASTPPPAKQVSLLRVLFSLTSTLLIVGLILWQLVTVRTPTLPDELNSAEKALHANNEKAARRQFEQWIAKMPADPVSYQAIMAICSLNARYNMGFEYGQRGLQACKFAPNPGRAELYLALSEVALRSHEASPQPKAQWYAHRALELDPANPTVLNGYGYILADNARTLQEVNVAFDYVSRALETLRAQTNEDALTLAETEDSYGWVLFKRGRFTPSDYPKAADALMRAVDDLPHGVTGEVQKEFYYHLGTACHAAGRIEDARHALQVALFYDPKFPEALKEMSTLPPASPAPLPLPSNASTPGPSDKTLSDKHAPSVSVPTTTTDGKPLFKPLPGH